MRNPLWLSTGVIGVLATLGASACGDADDSITLPNGYGKADGASIRVRLTSSNPVVRMTTRCDTGAGCDGHLFVDLLSPSPCELLAPDDPRCSIGGMEPASFQLGTVTVTSDREGTRELDFMLSTGDGAWFSTSAYSPFTSSVGAEVEFVLAKDPEAPDLLVEISAEWTALEPGGATELEEFLATISGLSFEPITTSYPGYRAYRVGFDQPLDHEDPDGRRFTQRLVLHHRHVSAPTVLYTTGYSLFFEDYLAELTDAMGANQISTEQRFFDESVPVDATADDWKFVTIRQAAADHHRLIEALRPFYSGAWLSTGHSKGGMTSIYHRRFHPNDLDGTVAYVAPISFAAPDPRYIPFLDQIGRDDCRAAVRALQREELVRYERLASLIEEQFGLALDRASFEQWVVPMEWSFWQAAGVDFCPFVPGTDASDQELVAALFGQIGPRVGPGVQTELAYNFQAATQLGYQDFAQAHLADLLQYEFSVEMAVPDGLVVVHDPEPMQDVQAWITTEARQILFIYGEYDPWAGGAFEMGPPERTLRLTAPGANHGAAIRELADADRALALEAVERWTGVRPAIEPTWQPSAAPLPPGLLYESLRR